MLVLAVDHFADRTDKIGKLIRAAEEYSQYGYRNQRSDDHFDCDSRDMRAILIQGNLVVVTMDMDMDNNTRLVRLFHGIHLLVIIGPQMLRGLPIRQ